jgi:hypothetical protein
LQKNLGESIDGKVYFGARHFSALSKEQTLISFAKPLIA